MIGLGRFHTAPAWSDSLIQRAGSRTDCNKLKAGDRLWDIAEKYYGNAHYNAVLVLYNKISDPAKLLVSTGIKAPDLKTILEDEGLIPLIGEEMDCICAARAGFMNVEGQLSALHKESGFQKATIPAGLNRELVKAADLIDKAIRGLSIRKDGVGKVPHKMIGQLERASGNLRPRALGNSDGYGYDIDMVSQNLVRAFVNGITWARNGYK